MCWITQSVCILQDSATLSQLSQNTSLTCEAPFTFVQLGFWLLRSHVTEQCLRAFPIDATEVTANSEKVFALLLFQLLHGFSARVLKSLIKVISKSDSIVYAENRATLESAASVEGPLVVVRAMAVHRLVDSPLGVSCSSLTFLLLQ